MVDILEARISSGLNLKKKSLKCTAISSHAVGRYNLMKAKTHFAHVPLTIVLAELECDILTLR